MRQILVGVGAMFLVAGAAYAQRDMGGMGPGGSFGAGEVAVGFGGTSALTGSAGQGLINASTANTTVLPACRKPARTVHEDRACDAARAAARRQSDRSPN